MRAWTLWVGVLIATGCGSAARPTDSTLPTTGTPTGTTIPFPPMEGSYALTIQPNMDSDGTSLDRFQTRVQSWADDPGATALQHIGYVVEGANYLDTQPYAILLVACTGRGSPEPACIDAMDVRPTPLGQAVSDAIVAQMDSRLATLGNPVGLEAALDPVGDFTQQLLQPTLTGTLTVDPTDSTVAFHAFGFEWDGAQRTIALEPTGSAIELADYQRTHTLELVGRFTAVDQSAVARAAIETVVLPSALTPSIDSFEAYYTELLDCAELATAVTDATGTGGSAIEAQCETLLTTLSAGLEPRLDLWLSGTTHTQLELDGQSHVPCPAVLDPDGLEVVGLGTEASPCSWGVHLEPSVDALTHSAAWWATRLPAR